MKTRFSSLVALKKDAMQKSERLFEQANQKFIVTKKALEEAIAQLEAIPTLQKGVISDFMANRALLDAQRRVIAKNEQLLQEANSELLEAKEALKRIMMEHEKFKYLHLQEVHKILDEQKRAEVKALDEVALMTYDRKTRLKEVL
jgi:flagellar biosynthesis chaperone FliJ